MKKLRYYYGLLIFVFFGCAQNSESISMAMADEVMATQPTKAKSAAFVERKLIKKGRVEFETENIAETRTMIFKAVDKYKGYVSSDEEFKSSGKISNTVIIRVPAVDFDNLLLDATQGVERFDSKEINIQDVTEEFLDIQARLKTKKELEQRYVELLKKANKVTEILEIEKQIGELRSEIESIEGRLNYLKDSVSFSTLSITFYEAIPNETQFGRQFKNGFKNGWKNFIWFFVMLTNIWPFVLLCVAFIFGIRMYRRKTKE